MWVDPIDTAAPSSGNGSPASDAAQFMAEIHRAQASNVKVLASEPSIIPAEGPRTNADLLRRAAGTMMELEGIYQDKSSKLEQKFKEQIGRLPYELAQKLPHAHLANFGSPGASPSSVSSGNGATSETARTIETASQDGAAGAFAAGHTTASQNRSALDSIISQLQRRPVPHDAVSAAADARERSRLMLDATLINARMMDENMRSLSDQALEAMKIQLMSAELQTVMTNRSLYMDWGKNIISKIGEAFSRLTQGS